MVLRRYDLYLYLMYTFNGILFSHKKDEILPSAGTWMDLENIILSGIRKRKTNITYDHLHVESKK